MHTRLPFLKVAISSSIYSLNFESTTYDLPVGGRTFPIKIFFDGMVPVNDVKIDVKFTKGLPGVSFINQTSNIICIN